MNAYVANTMIGEGHLMYQPTLQRSLVPSVMDPGEDRTIEHVCGSGPLATAVHTPPALLGFFVTEDGRMMMMNSNVSENHEFFHYKEKIFQEV